MGVLFQLFQEENLLLVAVWLVMRLRVGLRRRMLLRLRMRLGTSCRLRPGLRLRTRLGSRTSLLLRASLRGGASRRLRGRTSRGLWACLRSRTCFGLLGSNLLLGSGTRLRLVRTAGLSDRSSLLLRPCSLRRTAWLRRWSCGRSRRLLRTKLLRLLALLLLNRR